MGRITLGLATFEAFSSFSPNKSHRPNIPYGKLKPSLNARCVLESLAFWVSHEEYICRQGLLEKKTKHKNFQCGL